MTSTIQSTIEQIEALTKVIAPSPKRNLVFSPSGIGTAQHCLREYMFSRSLRLAPIQANENMDRGSLVHWCLEQYYKTLIREPKVDRLSLVQVILSNMRIMSTTMEMSEEIIEKIVLSFPQYVNHYINDWVPLHVEHPFIKLLFENDELRIFIEGKIDLIADSGEGIIFADHKSTEREAPTFVGNQLLAYSWATNLNTAFINEFGLQKTKKSHEKFRRHLISILPDMLEEWIENTIHTGLELDYYLQNSQTAYIPRKYDSCSYCAFNLVCSSTPKMREMKMGSFYYKMEEHSLFEDKKVEENV